METNIYKIKKIGNYLIFFNDSGKYVMYHQKKIMNVKYHNATKSCSIKFENWTYDVEAHIFDLARFLNGFDIKHDEYYEEDETEVQPWN
jgi:hypothetical protein